MAPAVSVLASCAGSSTAHFPATGGAGSGAGLATGGSGVGGTSPDGGAAGTGGNAAGDGAAPPCSANITAQILANQSVALAV